jgi:hypothetical protein
MVCYEMWARKRMWDYVKEDAERVRLYRGGCARIWGSGEA